MKGSAADRATGAMISAFRRVRLLKLALILFGAAAFVISGATAVLASWPAASTGQAGARVATLPAGIQPSVSVSPPASTDVAVSWALSAGGAPVAGYEVRAYATSSGSPRVIGGTCTGIVAGATCTDTSVPNGSWRYSVVPRQQQWHGVESPLSVAAIVDPGYRSFVVSDGPSAYWRLGESSGTTAVDEMGTSDGTYTGGYTLGQTGVMVGDANTAVALNGTTGKVVVPATATGTNITGNLSVEAWIKPNATQPAFARVVSRYNSTIVQYMLAYDTPGQSMRFLLDVTSGRPNAASTIDLRDGLWHHVVGTWDGTTARLYIDGAQAATSTGSGDVLLANTTTMIGHDSTGSPSLFSGVVDETALYDNTLSPAQILTHFQRGSLNRPTALVTFPVQGARYNTASWNAGCSIAICGTAADADGSVASVAVSVRRASTGLFWNGSSFASATPVLVAATGTTSWSVPFAGSNLTTAGTYVVTVVVTDDNAKTGGVTKSFIVDRTIPTAAITFPAASGAYTSANWNTGCAQRICGTASDDSGFVASVTVSLRQGTGNYWNGTAFASATEVLLPATGTTSWARTFSGASFPAGGAYTLHAVATDAAGNAGSTSRTFTIDNAAPTVAISFPTTSGAYNAATWDAGCASTICGTASDDSGTVASVTVSLRQDSGNYWNGTAFASATEVLLPATGTTTWTRAFSAASFPADGAYTLHAVATDPAGNAGSTSRTFTIDNAAPTVAIGFPTNGGTYTAATWDAACASTICGTASDDSGTVASVTVSIRQGTGNYWNGTAFASATEVLLPATGTTTWTRAFPAANFPANGTYTAGAVATDTAGNTATTSTDFALS